jgi:hypothetical protein
MDTTRKFILGIAAAAVSLATIVSASQAFSLRTTQVPFSSSTLQGIMTAALETTNAATDQLDAQVWSTALSGNTVFTIYLKANPNSDAIGVYNSLSPSPALYQVFPAAAGVDWYATCSFKSSGLLTVSWYDNNSVPQGYVQHTGVDRNHFGFYLTNGTQTYYSQDYRNPGGNAQMLTYNGTNLSQGEFWQCFEDQPYNASTSSMTSVILLLESVIPVGAAPKSWGSLKRAYR